MSEIEVDMRVVLLNRISLKKQWSFVQITCQVFQVLGHVYLELRLNLVQVEDAVLFQNQLEMVEIKLITWSYKISLMSNPISSEKI